MNETMYQGRIVRRIKKEFPGAVVLKNDSGYIQGFPDLTILYFSTWAVLEVKMSEKAEFQSNQLYYIQQLNEMSYAGVIHPGNEELVFDELRAAFEPFRPARIPVR